MNSAADLGGIFIILGVTALAFAQIMNMRQTDLGDRSDSDQFRGCNAKGPSRVCLLSVIPQVSSDMNVIAYEM